MYSDDTQGHAITKIITLPHNRLWDRVEINKTENPLGTVRFTVLRPYASPVFYRHENLSVSTDDISDILVDDTDKLYLEFWLDGQDRKWPTVDWLRIYWKPDPPRQLYDFPQVRLREDEPAQDAINLTNYFADWYTGGFRLVFQASYSSNPDHVRGVVRGYNLSIELPTKDWYGTEIIRVNCSDGEFTTESRDIIVVVTPVNDSPVISSLGTFEATEESVSVLNLTPFLVDVDTPIERLRIETNARNCTVMGSELHFLYTVGRITEKVDVSLSDGEFTVHGKLDVTVLNVNDRPVISAIPIREFTEEMPFTIDLAPYLTDEDDNIEDLVITTEDPNVIEISGRSLTLLFREYIEPTAISFNVSDGEAKVSGTIPVIVEPVNDPPVILSIGGKPSSGPISFELLEGGQTWLSVIASDIDSEILSYEVASDLGGVEILSNGTLRMMLSHGDVGTYWAIVMVDDLDGGTAEVNITLMVANVNDSPAVPRILSPTDGAMFNESAPITFNGAYSDPDTTFGQVLRIIWSSNISGELKRLTSDELAIYTLSNLTPGRHLITVTVSDGEFERSASLNIIVKAKPSPPNGSGPDGEGKGISMIIIGVIAVITLVAVVGAFLLLRTRKSEERERAK